MMNELIRKLFLEAFDDPALNKMEDCATLVVEGKRLTLSTDSYIVDPIFFPGGNIGELAVNGTVNDLSMAGARPLYLSVGFILEEGFSMQELHTIVDSMQAAARQAGVAIVTGDTKVVDKGKADKIFVNTSGVGVIEHECVISPERIETGDCVLLSGTIGDHGIAVFSQREGLSFDSPIESDTAALNGLVGAIVEAGGDRVRALVSMRTRIGGVRIVDLPVGEQLPRIC